MSLKGSALNLPPPLSIQTVSAKAGLNIHFQSGFCVHVDKVAALHLASQAVAFLIKQSLL